jgi:hypothetical protein
MWQFGEAKEEGRSTKPEKGSGQMRYRIQIQASQELVVEANSAEEARMKVVDGKIPNIKQSSCDDMSVDVYVSDAMPIDETAEYAKYIKER